MVQGQVIASGMQNRVVTSVPQQQQQQQQQPQQQSTPQQQIPLNHVIQRIIHPGGRVEEKIVPAQVSSTGHNNQMITIHGVGGQQQILQQTTTTGQPIVIQQAQPQQQQQQQQVVVSSGAQPVIVTTTPTMVGQTQVMRTSGPVSAQVSSVTTDSSTTHHNTAHSTILQDLLKSKPSENTSHIMVGSSSSQTIFTFAFFWFS